MLSGARFPSSAVLKSLNLGCGVLSLKGSELRVADSKRNRRSQSNALHKHHATCKLQSRRCYTAGGAD